MLLQPRYGDTPVITLDGDPASIGAPLIGQRRRVADTMRRLTPEQWARPSRCAGWSALDVAAHLLSTNSFWETSIRSGLAGEPTRILSSFDPVATPARMVAGSAHTVADVVEAFVESTESLAEVVAGLAPSDWELLAEAPPGHVSVSAVAHHALWDSWIHERDILLPLGESPPEEPTEVIAGLRWVVSLAPALALGAGTGRTGAFDVSATDPDTSFHVDIDTQVTITDGATSAAFVLTGGAADLLEALSFRAPLAATVPGELDWAFSGLGSAFDR